MFSLFKYPILYVRIFRNKIEVKNINTGKTISRKAVHNFSNERLIIANFMNVEVLLRELSDEVSNIGWVKRSTKMLVQPVDDVIKEISEVERRAYIDSAQHAGAKFVLLQEDQTLLTDGQVIKLFS